MISSMQFILQKPQIVYIGDICQIPPVMDDAVLGYKMLEFMPQGKLVELTQVYRHAGAIVNLATRIRQGRTIPSSSDVSNLDNKKEYPDERYMLPYLANPRKLPFKYTNHALKLESFTEIEDKVFEKKRMAQLLLSNIGDLDLTVKWDNSEHFRILVSMSPRRKIRQSN
jgi:hypothetical protein